MLCRARLLKWAIFAGIGILFVYLLIPNTRQVVQQPVSRSPNGRSLRGIFNQFLRPATSIQGDGSDAGADSQTLSYTSSTQKMLVTDALKRVRHAASSDPTVIRVASTKAEVEQVDREKALLAMMGIRHGQEESDAAPVRIIINISINVSDARG